MRTRLTLSAVVILLGLPVPIVGAELAPFDRGSGSPEQGRGAPPPPQAQTQAPPAGDELAGAPRISQAEFKKAVDAGTVLVIDVRDAQAYANGHVPGALSIPLDQLASHAPELKGEKRPIVTYWS